MRQRVHELSALALARFAARACRAAGLRGRVDVLVTNNSEMRSLNRRFRGRNKATDVLSFPAEAGARLRAAVSGDVAISADIAAANAARLGHSVADELKVLVLHGMLHLASYDHEGDGGRMARKEQQLRRELRLPEALIERATAASGRKRLPRRSSR